MRLSDVARVELGAEEAELVGRLNDRSAAYLEIWPVIGTNEIDVAHRIEAEMDRIRPALPKDIDMRYAYDGTMFMEAALKEIAKTLTETILIVAVVVFLFLGSVRTALVPLVAMPISLIGAAIVMYAFGFSLNLLTILAIVLSVGLVVDDAIVVVENVERHVRAGQSRVDAAISAARELRGPIIAMTITLATVYTPLAFQGGLSGSLFLEFAITLAAAVVVSGVVAVTLSPMMSARFVHADGQQGRLTAFVNRGFEFVRRGYARLLDGALEMRWPIVVAALLITVSAWPLYSYLAARTRAGRGSESHQPVLRGVARCVAGGRGSLVAGGLRRAKRVPGSEAVLGADRIVGRLRRHGREALARTEAVHRGDVRRSLRGAVEGAGAARVPASRSAAADVRAI